MKNALNENSLPEFIGQIIDGFEDYLEEKGISLQNEDRDEAIASAEYDSPEEAAIIYGCQYGVIGDTITSVVEEFGLFDNQITVSLSQDSVISEIMVSFYEVLVDGGQAENDVSEEDAEMLRDYVRSTFENWGLFA